MAQRCRVTVMTLNCSAITDLTIRRKTHLHAFTTHVLRIGDFEASAGTKHEIASAAASSVTVNQDELTLVEAAIRKMVQPAM